METAKDEGIKEASIKNAKNFLLMGLDGDLIAKGTGLSKVKIASKLLKP